MVSKLLPNFCTASIVSGGLLFWNLDTIGFLDVTCTETNGLEFIPMTSPSNDRAHERGQQAFFFYLKTSYFRLRLLITFRRFQPQIILKLFLFPDISKQRITCPEN